MNLNEIKELFDKLELMPTLDSIGMLLPYTDDINPTIAFKMIYNRKYLECTEEFEGLNEYDYITQVLNFDLSELKKNIELFSQKELAFLKYIINNALTNIEKNELTNRIITILNEYKDIGNDKSLEENNLENFFSKFDYNEIYVLDIILGYNCDPHVKNYRGTLNKILQAKENKSKAIKLDSNFSSLLNEADNLNTDELNLLYNLVENASSYLSSVQDYSYAYKDVIDDFDINEYPVISIYNLEKGLLKELESREAKNKQFIYK